MDMEITCINCPVGCRLAVELENGQVVSVTGNTCPRGVTYAKQECVDPLRMVTAVVPVEGSAAPLSVKTKNPIPKKEIKNCMKELANAKLVAPIKAGTVVVGNVCGTGVDIIATKSV